jgi:hypothetical protein
MSMVTSTCFEAVSSPGACFLNFELRAPAGAFFLRTGCIRRFCSVGKMLQAKKWQRAPKLFIKIPVIAPPEHHSNA